MNDSQTKTKSAVRRDIRYPQLQDLSVIYEGFTEDIAIRPPDLSRHGMFINTMKEYPEGAVLKLSFRLSRTNVLIETRSEVRYCLKGVGIGVEFINISPESASAIEEELSLLAASI